MKQLCLFLCLLFVLGLEARDADIGWGPAITTDKNIYVSTTGKDTNTGTIASPFLTLTKAKTYANSIKSSSTSGVTIWLRGGTYYLPTTFSMTSSDAGTASKPIIYRAYANENVILSGAKAATPANWVNYSGATSRLNPAVTAAQIKECTLTNLAMSVTGLMPDKINDVNNGFYQYTNLPGVYWNGVRQKLARFPNDFPNYMEVKSVVTGGDATLAGVFQYKTATSELYDANMNRVSGREAAWAAALSHGVYVKGYWRVNWQITTLKLTAIDLTAKTMTVTPSVTLGNKYKLPLGSGHEPYYVVNLLEEIDQPGEWCIDNLDGKLYYYAPSTITSTALTISDNKNPMIDINGASYIQFIGLEIMDNLGNAVKMTNCNNVQLNGCIIHDVEYDAVVINGGTNCGVLSSNLYDLGASGVLMGAAGTALAGSNHFVSNCHIYNFGYLNNIYAAAINLAYKNIALFGAKADHNSIHDCPHSGVLHGGSNNLFEYNDVYHTSKCSDDMGAFYCFTDSNANGGNTLRYNLMHNSLQGDGVYFDHFGLNDKAYSNVAYQLNRGFLYRAGWNQDVQNNIAYKCRNGFQLATAFVGAKALKNVAVANPKQYVMLNGTLDASNKTYNTMSMRFTDELNLDFSLLPSSQIFKDIPTFENFPSSGVGLYIDSYRISKVKPLNYNVNPPISGVYGS
ncbi:MAG: right-handed parallel beta-helix repeat-containing protein [Bacteroidales bacterium]